jgi:hypothetical protein
MKTPAEVLLFVGVLFVQGCTYVPSVEPTDLSAVYEETATRSEIEAVLGEPVESRVTDNGSISIYKYNRGARGGIEEPLGDPGFCVGDGCLLGLLVYPFVWASTPLLYANKKDKQKRFLAVVYSADDPPTIMQLSGNDDPDALMVQTVARLQLIRRAQEGDPDAQLKLADAQLKLAFIAPKDQRQKWLCLAAHGGNAKAQDLMMYSYRYGLPPLKEGEVQALKWEMLAKASGYTNPTILKETKPTMRPEQIAEAERLVAEWKPNPAECEGEAVLAAD